MFELKLNLPDCDETVADYVQKVGTCYAIAMYRVEQRRLLRWKGEAYAACKAIFEALELVSLPSDIFYDELDVAFGSRQREIDLNLQYWESQEKEVWALPFSEGSSPGTQEQLELSGIKISLRRIKEEYDRRMNAD